MDIEFVSRNFAISDKLRDHAQDKIEKIGRFVEDPVEVRLTLSTEKHHSIAELHISHRHGVLQATDQNVEMFDAVNQVIEKVEKQARRSRKKFIDQRRRADRATTNGSRWPVEVLESASVDAGGGESPRIIKSSHLQIKPMSLDEAVLKLRNSKNEFVVFRHSSTQKINVLYRRKDENYGLITPEM